MRFRPRATVLSLAGLLMAGWMSGCQFVDGIAPTGDAPTLPDVPTLVPFNLLWKYDVDDTTFTAGGPVVVHRTLDAFSTGTTSLLNDLFDIQPGQKPQFSNQAGGFFIFTTQPQIPSFLLPYPTKAGAVSQPGPVTVLSTDSMVTVPGGVFQTVVYLVNNSESFLIQPEVGVIRKEIATGTATNRRHVVYQLTGITSPDGGE